MKATDKLTTTRVRRARLLGLALLALTGVAGGVTSPAGWKWDHAVPAASSKLQTVTPDEV